MIYVQVHIIHFKLLENPASDILCKMKEEYDNDV